MDTRKELKSGSGEGKEAVPQASESSLLEQARLRTFERDKAHAEGKSPPPPEKPARISGDAEPALGEKHFMGAFSGKTELPLEHTSPEDLNRQAAQQNADASKTQTWGSDLNSSDTGGFGTQHTPQKKGGVKEKQPAQKEGRKPLEPEDSEKTESIPNEAKEKKGEGAKMLSDIHVSDQKTLLRTYEGDAAQALRKGGGSVATIALAEQKKRRGEEGAPRTFLEKIKNNKILLVLSTAVFIIGGAALLFFVGKLISDRGNDAIVSAEKSELIFTEETVVVNTTDMSATAFQNKIDRLLEGSLTLSSFTEIIPYTVEVEWPIRTSLADVAFFLSLGASDSLLRSLGPGYALAIHSFDGNHLVLVAEVDSYERAFAGMLAWEPSMGTDFARFLPEPPEQKRFGMEVQYATTSTSTEQAKAEGIGTATPPEEPLQPRFPTDRFVDLVVLNQDVRALYNADDEKILLYAFPTRDVLVITTSLNSFEKVLERLNTAEFSR